eukprot:CAMPEP_0185568166 /NCGR_PEP_ID=MMETSP0434-20130131/1207_1 /TAXON_ID=626734 ORGANISM="Favella taraikaensis, Strain Fe Narragansett Bay" /NCGR_SAMPLE_ID=MMETSP0434 /ASSEMBLY_ACC=CAM_ASM_000379 /LENGTH=56 /DNA_ID=CAMNT_0028182583 /DNA_START=1637 /DNA_END=1807 /DNA_ORIENTATION=-
MEKVHSLAIKKLKIELADKEQQLGKQHQASKFQTDFKIAILMKASKKLEEESKQAN